MTLAKASIVTVIVVGIGAALLSAARAIDNGETSISLEELPAAVREAVVREAQGGTILAITTEVEEGEQIYEAQIRFDVGGLEIEFAADGTAIEQEPLGDDDEGEWDDEDDAYDDANGDDGEPIANGDLPDVVREMFIMLSGQDDFRVWAEQEHGTRIYEARWEADGNAIEAEVNEAGVLLEMEENLPETSVPEAVRLEVAERLPAAGHVDFVKMTFYVYKAEVVVDGRVEEITILPTGHLFGQGD